MSATSGSEGEDLENVPLVRMEDVQPVRTELYDLDDDDGQVINDVVIGDELLETCVVDSVDSDCMLNEDGDVVVTIQTEMVECDSSEIIVPEVLEPPLDDPLELVEEIVETRPKTPPPKTNTPGSWPTLEILPGGVIKHADKYDDDISSLYPTVAEKFQETKDNNEMVYACAKCSQSFKYLLCLVKHVKWHEEQQKKARQAELGKITTTDHMDYVCLHSNKRKIISKLKSRCKFPKKS